MTISPTTSTTTMSRWMTMSSVVRGPTVKSSVTPSEGPGQGEALGDQCPLRRGDGRSQHARREPPSKTTAMMLCGARLLIGVPVDDDFEMDQGRHDEYGRLQCEEKSDSIDHLSPISTKSGVLKPDAERTGPRRRGR